MKELSQAERQTLKDECEHMQDGPNRQSQEIRRLRTEFEIRPEPASVQMVAQELASWYLSLSEPLESGRQPEVPGSRTCLLATINCLQANLQREKERAQALEQVLESLSKESGADIPTVTRAEEARILHCEPEAFLTARMREMEDEVLSLREELNAEKKKALDAKLAEQSRRTVWRGELSRLEERHAAALSETEHLHLELSKKEPLTNASASQSPQKLRQILSMFLVHVQGPLAVVRGICEDLCSKRDGGGGGPPPGPSPVPGISGDDAFIAELVRLVELLRFFAAAVDEKRSLRTLAQRVEAVDNHDSCRRGRHLLASDEADVVSPAKFSRPVAEQISGAAEWVGVAAIDDTVERVGIATAQAVANPKWVNHIDQTTDRMAEWLLSKLPP